MITTTSAETATTLTKAKTTTHYGCCIDVGWLVGALGFDISEILYIYEIFEISEIVESTGLENFPRSPFFVL